MAADVFIPKLGQTVEEVVIVNWLVKDGDQVEQGQEILEVETDKAVFPIEAMGKGTIHIGPYNVGDTIPVLQVVAIIGKKNDTFEDAAVETTEAAGEKAPKAQPKAAPSGSQAPPSPSPSETPYKVFASPRARKLAAHNNLDLGNITPTGYGGIRIVERDIAAFLEAAPKATPVARNMAAAGHLDLHQVTGTGASGKVTKSDVLRHLSGPFETGTSSTPIIDLPDMPVRDQIPLTGIRGKIVQRMSMSAQTTSRVTLFMETDATELVVMRNRLKERAADEWGFSPGYNDFLALIAARALREFPYMNARFTPEAIELLVPVNIGMAVDTERGLVVPVIRNADQKSLREFGEEFRSLVEQARSGRISPDHLSGGTFTITNLGIYDVTAFTPVINLPEAAILGVGAIVQRPAAYQDEIALRYITELSLVFDHRIVDGAPAARFLQFIKDMIEEPYLWLTGS
ncbi:MAG: 2-oxo acid dehydrogenase subunit E2 [Anaerolineales bacterium]|nr:2-oxo acid dehydrogenase subunit E2 [Anaerolineales bacterium]